jgi:hypothetical protein
MRTPPVLVVKARLVVVAVMLFVYLERLMCMIGMFSSLGYGACLVIRVKLNWCC